jgi:hypothetical protein
VCYGPQLGFKKFGKAGLEICDLFTSIGSVADEICLVRSMWTEQITGEKKKMARVDITVAEVSGLSILAPEGAKIAASPGGRGAEIEDSAYGYLIWVHEDPTATLDLMKQGATAWNKDAKFVKETPTSIVISQPSFDGSPAFYYKGIYKSGSKVIVCETPSSIAPTKQEHAEQIGKACDSLEAAGGVKLVADAGAPAAEPEASASAVAANDPPPANAPVAVANNAPPPSKPQTNTTSAPPKTTSAGNPPATKTTTAPTSKPRRPGLKKLH